MLRDKRSLEVFVVIIAEGEIGDDALRQVLAVLDNVDDFGVGKGFQRGGDQRAFLGVGNGFGRAPDYSLRTGLLNFPTMMVQAGYTGQGYTTSWQTLIEITPDGPVTRAEVETLQDTTGASYDALKPCVLEGTIRPSRTGGDNFFVDYRFTADVKGEDRTVEYKLNPETGAYDPDYEYQPELCINLMYDAAEAAGDEAGGGGTE